MKRQELTLFGGWAKVLLPKPIRIGVLKPSDFATTSTIFKSGSAKLIEFVAKYPPDRVPIDTRSLFREYLQKVASNPLERMIWVTFDYGHKVEQLVRDEHIACTYELLLSEDRTKVKMAEEVMQRTVGIYEIR